MSSTTPQAAIIKRIIDNGVAVGAPPVRISRGRIVITTRATNTTMKMAGISHLSNSSIAGVTTTTTTNARITTATRVTTLAMAVRVSSLKEVAVAGETIIKVIITNKTKAKTRIAEAVENVAKIEL